MAEKMRVAVYCRLALKDDDRMDEQKHSLLQYAAEQGYNDVVFYCDNGASGNDFNRQAFSLLNADIAAGKIDMIIARSYDRFGRDFIQTEAQLAAICDKGVIIKTMDGFCDEPLHSYMVDVYSELVRRTKRGVAKNAPKGGV